MLWLSFRKVSAIFRKPKHVEREREKNDFIGLFGTR